jgi:ribosome-binding factor A
MTRIKIKRLESELQKLVSTLLTFKIRDKRLKMVNITAVRLSDDLSYARFYYNTLDPTVQNIQSALDKSAGFFKKEIAAAQIMRTIPEIVFEFDKVEDNARKLDEIFARINKEKNTEDDPG